jgi:hypothetical protein
MRIWLSFLDRAVDGGDRSGSSWQRTVHAWRPHGANHAAAGRLGARSNRRRGRGVAEPAIGKVERRGWGSASQQSTD